MSTEMTSLERVLTTLGHQEPDRVPMFLLLTLHGAKELGMGIEEYYSKAENVAEGQLKLREKYRNDCIYSFFYAPIEVEAWGGDVLYFDDGPPNAGAPIIRDAADIPNLQVPVPEETPCLKKVLDATRMIKERVGDEVPIIGVVMSPYSLPVMQMGFPKYIELMYEQPELFEKLMQINEEFCVAWANAQLDAGATAICYFDPVSSSTVTDPKHYRETGYAVAKRTIARINGPTATHMASGRALPIITDIAETGTAVLGCSVMEDLVEVKEACRGKLTVMGNLNAIDMRHWTPEIAEQKVKEALRKAAPGGGYILAENHGEVPWQVPEEVLLAISEAVHKWGVYPINIPDDE